MMQIKKRNEANTQGGVCSPMERAQRELQRNAGMHETWQSWERTLDGMFRQRIKLYQHKRGYRFSIDAVLLSHFALRGEPAQRILDVCSGCGIVALCLAYLAAQQERTPTITGVEVQPSLAALARENVALNELAEQIQIVEQDIRAPLKQGSWDLITINPPYFAPQQSQMSPHPEKAAARHEVHGSLEELIASCARELRRRGQLDGVFPAAGFPRMLQALHAQQMHLARLRFVHSQAHEDARLVLFEAGRRLVPLQVEPPLVLYSKQGQYTPQVEAMLDGQPVAPYPQEEVA